MNYPRLKTLNTSRQLIGKFGGLDVQSDAPAGTFFTMENMSSQGYPALAPRASRALYEEAAGIGGILGKDSLCYVREGKFVINGYALPMDLSEGEKTLVSMGAYVVIFPDKKYVNTLDLTDFGPLEAEFVSQSDVEFILWDLEGGELSYTAGATPPENPENGAYWLDTSNPKAALRQYSAQSERWSQVASTYIKIISPGIGREFALYDGVKISGILPAAVEDLNGSAVIWDRGEDYIVVPGILESRVTQSLEDGAVRVERSLPDMDFVIECGNRLWGCRYGLNSQGQPVNEIYASKLGDFKNFSCYMGLSTDSYAVSLGTDGPFTGAFPYLGYPLFFKEAHLHKIYGSYPAAYQVQSTPCAGVGKGSGKSLAMVENTLYYLGKEGVMAYDGSLPRCVSRQLGSLSGDGVGGGWQGKYYLSCDAGLLVYDVRRGLWHREDNLPVRGFAGCNKGFFAYDTEGIWEFGSGQEVVSWSAQTGPLGLTDPDRGYISRLIPTLSLPAGSRISFALRYDGAGDWLHAGTLEGKGSESFSLPLRTRRCSFVELKLWGTGPMKLHSLGCSYEKGSDMP